MVVARAAILLLSSSFVSASAFSQFPVPTPTPTPRPGSRAAAVPAVVRDNSSYDRLRTIESMTDKTYIPRHPLLDRKTGIYRRPGPEESKALAVSETLIREFEAFLAAPDTGIVKLKALPRPNWLLTQIRPPCSSTSSFAIASPKPVPPT